MPKTLPVSEDAFVAARNAEVYRRRSEIRSDQRQVYHNGGSVAFRLRVLTHRSPTLIERGRMPKVRLHWTLLKTMQL